MKSSAADGAKRLLIVDDDEAVQALMDAVFQRQAVMVEHASDGNIALELLRKEASMSSFSISCCQASMDSSSSAS